MQRVDAEVLNDPDLDPTIRLMLRLNRWVGFRVSELVECPIDGLRHNGDGGYWLDFYTPKTRSWRGVPLPNDLAALLREQQDRVRETYGDAAKYLFPSTSRSSGRAGTAEPMTSMSFRNNVRAAFARANITHSTVTGEPVTGGEIHRYRHTIGTTLLNHGWTQAEVQQFLGHASPTMTAHYAEILDDTLVRKVREFREQQADHPELEAAIHPGVERMRARFAYELPDGGCTLPASKSCETRDNPCTGCAFFDPGGHDIREVHENRRKRLKLHIANSTDAREVEMNQAALNAVEDILNEAETDAAQ